MSQQNEQRGLTFGVTQASKEMSHQSHPFRTRATQYRTRKMMTSGVLCPKPEEDNRVGTEQGVGD